MDGFRGDWLSSLACHGNRHALPGVKTVGGEADDAGIDQIREERPVVVVVPDAGSEDKGSSLRGV